MHFPNLATDKNRWIALVFLALGLAIVIIDNTVLNVAIPYILKDLKTTLDALQWVISGYALIIATILITVGRIGDIFGRKKIFVLGTIFFAVGSFIASTAQNAVVLFLGEALIEAIGAAMMLTNSLSLLASEFHGKERAIAFGIWGSVAGVSATIGPLLGGFLTTYYSWRWSLRINVFVAIVAILGSVFIEESFGEKKSRFDWPGTVYSGIGLFSLIFGFIEGQKYGWWHPNELFTLGSISWPFHAISIIPFMFLMSIIFLSIFCWWEARLEQRDGSPLLRLSMFRNIGFSLGNATLGIVCLGQFGIFFTMPIYLQNVLGLNAFQNGIIFLPSSLSSLVFGPLSGFIASKIGPKWVVSAGMAFLAAGDFFLRQSISIHATGMSLAPALIVFGIGLGASQAQLTNLIISSVSPQLAGEASAVNSTMRQLGTSVGIAIIGTIFASSLAFYVPYHIKNDTNIPLPVARTIASKISSSSLTSREENQAMANKTPFASTLKSDVNQSLTDATRDALLFAFAYVLAGTILSLFIPENKHHLEKPTEAAPTAH